MGTENGDFTFPTLPNAQPSAPKAPLTLQSTVTHASTSGQQVSTSKPVKVAAEGRRNKVPLEKGFSQVDWLRLSRSGADLTGGAGHQRRDITLQEVRQHKTADDAWMVLHSKVYNITPYLKFHPGGADILVKAAGRDGTALFNKYHPWVNAHALLERCLLGLLAVQPPAQQQQQQQQEQQHKQQQEQQLPEQ